MKLQVKMVCGEVLQSTINDEQFMEFLQDLSQKSNDNFLAFPNSTAMINKNNISVIYAINS